MRRATRRRGTFSLNFAKACKQETHFALQLPKNAVNMTSHRLNLHKQFEALGKALQFQRKVCSLQRERVPDQSKAGSRFQAINTVNYPVHNCESIYHLGNHVE